MKRNSATLRLVPAKRPLLFFFLLALGDGTGNVAMKHFTGFEGIVCGASAVYAGIAQVLNEVYGKTMLPLWPVKK